MSDFDTIDTTKATPQVLMRRAGDADARAKAQEAEANAKRDTVEQGRAAEIERRKGERSADTQEYNRRSTDLQTAVLDRPHTEMPSADLGPPLDPEKTQQLAFGIIAMSLVGAMGGRKHWGEATAALDGLLKGFREGSEEKIKENKSKFEREFRLAKEKQAEATSVYQSVLKSKELSLNQVAELIRVHASANHDWEMEQAAREKNYQKMFDHVDKLRGQADNLTKAAGAMQDKIDARAEKRADKAAAAKASGSEGLSERYRTDPDYKKQVDYWAKAVQRGIPLPPRFAQSGAGKKMYPDIIAAVPTFGSGDPNDMAAGRLNQRELTAEAQKIGTQAASVAIATKELIRFIPLAEKAIDNVPRTAWKPLNQLLQAAENTWSPEQKALVIANRSVQNAFAQLIQRGAPTVHSLTEAEHLLNSADSPAVYKAGMKQLMQEAEQAEAGLQDARDDLMKRARSGGESSTAPTPYSDADKEARYQKWKAEHGGS